MCQEKPTTTEKKMTNYIQTELKDLNTKIIAKRIEILATKELGRNQNTECDVQIVNNKIVAKLKSNGLKFFKIANVELTVERKGFRVWNNWLIERPLREKELPFTPELAKIIWSAMKTDMKLLGLDIVTGQRFNT